jgi:thioredoxin-dependent peroxiredoxin
MNSMLTAASVTAWILGAGALACAPSPELKPGDPAPLFRLKGSDGRTYNLDEFRGKQAIVIAWFPKAFTGG